MESSEEDRPIGWALRLMRIDGEGPWAASFLITGVYALLCLPAVFVFEHFRWRERPLHTSVFLACVACVAAAAMHLRVSAIGASNPSRGWRVTRRLAWVAIALAGGYLALVIAVVAWMTTLPIDF